MGIEHEEIIFAYDALRQPVLQRNLSENGGQDGFYGLLKRYQSLLVLIVTNS